MAFDQLKGGAQEVAGTVQAKAGSAIGDQGMEAEGTLRNIGGKAQGLYGEAKDRLSDAASDVADKAKDVYANNGQGTAKALQDSVQKYPIAALLIAAGVGYVLSALTTGR